MIKRRIILIGFFSLMFTFVSPFVFTSYFGKKPPELTQKISFGAPFPFADQTFVLPENKDDYPLEVSFTSPLEKKTGIRMIPFLLSFACFYLFFFSFFSIVIRFFATVKYKERRKRDN